MIRSEAGARQAHIGYFTYLVKIADFLRAGVEVWKRPDLTTVNDSYPTKYI